jgi:hypothetical protein
MILVLEQSTGHLPEVAAFSVFGDHLDLGDDSVPFGLDHIVDMGKLLLPDIAFYDTLEELELSIFSRGHKGDRYAHVPGPARTADPVDVGIGIVGKGVVDNMGQVVDIDTPGRHIRGNEDVDPALSETVQDELPLGLGDVSVKGFRIIAPFGKTARQLVDVHLGSAEDEAVEALLNIDYPTGCSKPLPRSASREFLAKPICSKGFKFSI